MPAVLDRPASEIERCLALFGTDEEVPAPRRLTAGPLSAELIGGNLRNIRFAGREVIRAVSYVVRDKDWGTYAPRLENLAVAEDADGFTVSYDATCHGAKGERLAYRATIRATGDGLSFEAEAVPEQDFLTNRCGFTILHPIVGVAGRAVEVEHVDGSVEHAVLPDLIDPYQPFKAMRAITHEVMPGVTATCRMEGDSFEMEDQRNWTDASYKTYVRPLALPWPYAMPAGVMNRQAVRLSIEAAPGAVAVAAEASPEVSIQIGEAIGAVPRFGLVLAPGEAEATLAHIGRLTEIAPQLLLCPFDPTAGHGAAELVALARIARQQPAEVALECVAPCERPLADEFAELAEQVAQAGLVLDAIAVSPSVDRGSTPPGSVWPDCPPLDEVYVAARRAFPSLALGGGMFSYFTELNRKRPPTEKLDFVTHCTCPIVHDADDRSVMQSLEALPFVLRSARAIIGADKPYRVGPSTIGMRHNPYGSRTMPNPYERRITMTGRDPRQRGLFAAAWMIGYAARLAAAGVASFTGAALTGDFGLIEADGAVRPAFHAARMLAAMAGWDALDCRSSAEDRVLALAARGPDGERALLLANITGETQAVRLPFGVRAAVLDETTLAGARGGALPAEAPLDGPLELRPYAIARVTG